MTLILGVSSRHQVVLVTDRELTAGGRRFDARANKNVIYRASNGIVAIAFTGTAYIAGLPTDQWIVETITGYSIPSTDPPPSCIGVHGLPRWPDVGLAIRTLQREYERLRCTLHHSVRDGHFEIVAVGYQWKGPNFRPIATGYIIGMGESTGIVWSGLRDFDGRRFEIIISPATNGALCDMPRLQTELRKCGDAPAIQAVLAKAVGLAAARSPMVGSDCLSIQIDPPGKAERHVIVEYLPAEHPPEPLDRSGLREESARAFSPWIVSPVVIHAPSLHASAGDLVLDLAGYEARIQGIGKGDGTEPPMYFRGQVRRRWP